MTAISTATRYRNRELLQSFDVFDSLSEGSAELFRTLSDSLTVSDESVATYRTLKSGDRFILSDSDSFFNTETNSLLDSIAVSDFLNLKRNQSRVLFDFTTPKDDGFITDKDLFRYRQTVDTFSISDNAVKSITRTDFVVNTRVKLDTIDVNDSFLATINGVKIRLLSDSLEVVEKKLATSFKFSADNITISENLLLVRTFQRVLASSIAIKDDVIVGRSAIINSKTTNDSLVTTDRKTANLVTGTNRASRILHGIELY